MNDIATRSTDDLRVHLGLAQVALRYGQTLKARRQGLEAIEAIRREIKRREEVLHG